MRRLALAVLAVSLAAPTVLAQSTPPRPQLAADADTNDARSYYEWGRRPELDWKSTYNAYYWAQRLEPGDITYLRGLYVAFLNRHSFFWRRDYDRGVSRVAKSDDARLLDSLLSEIIMRDPYGDRRASCVFAEEGEQQRDQYFVGYVHYNNGCYSQANAAFAEALRNDGSLLLAHRYRARSFYYQQLYDSTVAELRVLIDSLRARDEKYLMQVYNSKAMFEYMIGFAEAHRHHWGPAREAYERALTEDLAFYIAHQRMAEAALEQSDVKTALAEYELAVGLKPGNAVLRNDYGRALYLAGHDAEAEAQLLEAVRLEPHWARPYYNLAAALASLKRTDEAIAQYEAFLARCPRRLASEAAEARNRIAKLRPGGGQGR